MATEKTNYDFNRSTRSGKPGFEPFAQSGFFYFHYNGSDGRPLLFSRAYAEAKERDIAMSMVCEIVRHPERYVVKEGKNGCYISVRAANRRELARTPDFFTRDEADGCLRVLLDLLPAESWKTDTAKNVNSNIPSREVLLQTGIFEAPRHYFDLRFYPDGQGVIQYPLTQETLRFKGLDERAIIGFVRKKLTQPLREIASPMPDDAQSRSIRVKKENLLRISLPFTTIAKADLLRSRKTEVIVSPVKENVAAKSLIFFYLKSLKNGQTIHLTNSLGNKTSTECSNATAYVVLPLLEAGIYRLIATNENIPVPVEAEGCLFQVI